MALHAVIIAGGSGTRFWPASRKALPKQFLQFEKGRSLIAATAQRLEGLVPMERVWVVCGAAHAPLVREHLPGIKDAHIVVEPEARNTAPAIALANAQVRKEDPEATIVVLPADHFVGNEPGFRAALAQAADTAQEGSLVTLGVKAIRPETGFGYIERGEKKGAHAYAIARFIEKPPLADAEKYVASGRHDWNGGIFVFTAKAFDGLLHAHAAEIAAPLDSFMAGKATLADAFKQMPSISIDYAVAEKAPNMRVVPLDADWSDVGGWDALPEVRAADKDGNVIDGSATIIDSKGNIIRSTKRVCLVGIDDLIIVDTKDALLVMKKGTGQRVRDMVAALQKDDPSLL
jgi:mannose-1-phosphate guanylyltransferase/mannose-6-phosphate isomerase